MDGFLRDLGFEYAKTLPGALATLAVVVVALGWVITQVHHGWDVGTAREPLLWLLTGMIIGVVLQFPFAYSSARSYCSDVLASSHSTQTLGGISYDPGGPDSIGYGVSKCKTIWPDGP